jgi:glycosyltransferase involved in cell wall biosynthesis
MADAMVQDAPIGTEEAPAGPVVLFPPGPPAGDAPVEAVPPSLKPLALAGGVIRLAAGGRCFRRVDNYCIDYAGTVLEMHQEDFLITQRAARRLAIRDLPLGTPNGLIDGALQAQKLVFEEICKPGAVRVLYLPSLSPASVAYRCELPTMALRQSDRVTAFVAAPGTPERAYFDFDVVVIQLAHSKAMQALARALREEGRRVVYEIDDAFDAHEVWHPRYETYRRPDVQAEVIEMIESVDRVTVTTEALKERYSCYSDRITVIPNYIDIANRPKAPKRARTGFRVLWAGSPSHTGDLAVLEGALNRFADLRKDSTFVFFGEAPAGLRVPPDRVEVRPFCDFLEYQYVLADIDADVALAPLAPVPFNSCKSPVKLVEYGAAGYPVIASDFGPYRMLEHGKTGMLCATEDDWVAALDMLWGSPEKRAALAEGSLELARRYDIDLNRPCLEAFFCGLGNGI